MLILANEPPTLYNDKHNGYARYRIAFEGVDPVDKYAVGWVSPDDPDLESIDYTNRIKNWERGWVREVFQEDTREVKAFRVRLYRVGINEDNLLLLEERSFRSNLELA